MVRKRKSRRPDGTTSNEATGRVVAFHAKEMNTPMPNGRGLMDCCYCLHWSIKEEEWGYGSGRYDGQCTCWDVAIPRSLTQQHRFCLDFTPSKYFGEDNGVGRPGETRSTEEIGRDCLRKCLQVKPDMQIGVLYHAPYGEPKKISELIRLDERPENSYEGKNNADCKE